MIHQSTKQHKNTGLLIVTQTVDTEDPILGFFVRWIAEFAKHQDQVHVLALNVGAYELPANVTVHCLGKSDGKGKLTQLWRLWHLSWQLRQQYQSVFCHMNPEYVLYGGLLWRLLGKKIGLWYTHGSLPRSLTLARHLTHHIFTASPESCRLKNRKKIIVTGHGIDTDFFSPGTRKFMEDDVLRMVVVGRIAPIKQIDYILEAVATLPDDLQWSVTVVGKALSVDDQQHENLLRDFVEVHNLADRVNFVGGKNQIELRDLLRKHDMLLHASQTGSLDKVLLEAQAVGLIIISTSYDSLCVKRENYLSITNLVDQIIAAKQKTYLKKNTNQLSTIKQNHTLSVLIEEVSKKFQ